jgi:hypothetical protein
MITAQPIENDKTSYRKTSDSVGIYTRESTRRKFRGKPDLCFDISYQIGNKLIWEKIGWKSEGFSLRDAENIRSRRMKAIRQIVLESGNGNAGRSEIIQHSAKNNSGGSVMKRSVRGSTQNQSIHTPPFTSMVSPVTKPALIEASRTTKAEISSGSPIRPTGT